MRVWLAALLIGAALAGCLGGDTLEAELEDGQYQTTWNHEDSRLRAAWTPGGLGALENLGDVDLTVQWPVGILLLVDDVFKQPTDDGEEIPAGGAQEFLAPPYARDIIIRIDGTRYELSAEGGDEADWDRVVDGGYWYDLMLEQQERFPHRTPGQPNYWAAIEYFSDFFHALGYEVEVDPFGTHEATMDGQLCLPGGPCPESFANVVATKHGADPDAPILFVGGHFDMVPGTTYGAFDNTAGTVGTLVLAEALSRFDFNYTLMFGLWGGEEDGILGSHAWVQSHPQLRNRIASYWNLDVIGMSWPAPLPDPDPILIAAGPDLPMPGSAGGSVDPLSTTLLEEARTIQQEWLRYPDEHFLYEGVLSGQMDGYAGVNAQSDHTAFMDAGIPAWFLFNGDAVASDNPVRIHSEADTLLNMTKYALWGGESVLEDPTISAEDLEAGREALARSIEATLMFPFYHTLLVETGVLPPANPLLG